jgi:hypothetical protein
LLSVLALDAGRRFGHQLPSAPSYCLGWPSAHQYAREKWTKVMGIRTRLTETLGIRLPILSALLGSRLWASPECLVHPNHQRAALAANGDGTIRQKSADIARGYEWPEEFTGRVLRTAFVARWHGREAEHRVVAEAARPDYWAAVAEGRTEECGLFIGEAIGLMRDVSPVAEILARVTNEAEALLRGRAAALVT